MKNLNGEYNGLDYRLKAKEELIELSNKGEDNYHKFFYSGKQDTIEKYCKVLNLNFIEALIMLAYEKKEGLVLFDNTWEYKFIREEDFKGNVKFVIEKEEESFIYNTEEEMIQNSKKDIGVAFDSKKFLKGLNGTSFKYVKDLKILWSK